MSRSPTQLAEPNNSNDPHRSVQFARTTVGSSESNPYNYSQLPVNYDISEIQQHESLLRSLAQNPTMAKDFGQFLEFSRVRTMQQQTQQFHYEQFHHQQQQIPSLLNNKANWQPTVSTPKRTRPLNESGGSISTAPKQQRTNNGEEYRTTNTRPTNDQQHRRSLSMDQLKRAVSSNLPCFFVEFDQSTTTHKTPAALEAREFLENHFKEQGIHIQRFSLVGWANKRLKLGVNNKEDYMALVATEKWPSEIRNVQVKILKPRFIPDCFALVVYYVPRELELEFVTDEIKRTIASASDIKQINYAYERKVNDYRFIVTDPTEYNNARELGRIALGNRLVPVTSFLSGNRMTYCTRCWKIGHVRAKCESNAQRCRVCLEEITSREEHEYSRIPKCAQCNGEHHSLHGQCHIVRQYRAELKEDVAKALETGRLHRNDNANDQMGFKMSNGEFPPLGGPKKTLQSAWGRFQPNVRNEETDESTEVLLRINANIIEMCEGQRRMEEKLEKLTTSVNQTALDAELFQSTLNKLRDHLQSLIQNVLGPVTSQVEPELMKSKTGLQSIHDNLRELKNSMNNDYQITRKQATSPAAQPISDKQTATSKKTASNNASTTQQI